MSDLSDPDDRSLCSRVECRTATPTDILRCFQLEKSWNKNASKIDLQYRQHHAAPFFRCAVMESGDDEDIIVGFVCSTRINEFQDDNVLKSHRASGTILMIHSIVVAEEYRRQGLGKLMLNDYLQSLRNASLKHPVSDVTVFATQELLTFFLHCGFSVVRPRANADDEEQQYLLTMSLDSSLQGTNGREFYVVDSFASKSGTGNPAAVVLLPEDTNIEELDKWMQTVAAEFNLSETAFCWPQSQAQNSENEVHWNVRFYTPKVEVPLCGHATLASAAVLYQTLQPKPQCRIVFHALEDELIMQLAPASETMTMRQRKICMEFPSKPPTKLTSNDDKSAVSKMLEAAFSCQLELTYIGISEIGDILVELTPESFWKIGYERLNYSALLEWDGYSRGIIVCCISECDSNKEGRDSTSPVPDFHSRFFGPKGKQIPF
jgi:predicted PhzF superfamily epimerase YddE/YHI9/GNAT superfamily N-acetyltransferase